MNIVKFGNVASRINIHVDQATTTLEYYIGGEHINSSDLMVHKKAPIKGSTIGYQFQFGFEKGDILFMTKNPHLRKASMVDFDGLCSIATFVIRSNDESVLLQDYLLLEMQSDRFWNYCEEHKSGGVNYFINWGTLSNYEFNLPSLSEQKVLADKLWAAYEVKQSYLKMIEATDEMLKAQFVEMFEDGQYTHITLDEVSQDWLKGQAFRKEDIIEDGVLPCIHYGELFTKYGPIIEKVLSRTNVEPIRLSKKGDILFPASDVTPNGLSRCSMLSEDNVLLGGDIIVLRPKKENDAGYLSCAINQQKSQLLKRVNGAVVKHLSAKGLKTVLIPIPPKEKQVEYVSIVHQADKSKAELRKSIEAIDKVIKSLINENL